MKTKSDNVAMWKPVVTKSDVTYHNVTFRCTHVSVLQSPPPNKGDVLWCGKCSHYRTISKVRRTRKPK